MKDNRGDGHAPSILPSRCPFAVVFIERQDEMIESKTDFVKPAERRFKVVSLPTGRQCRIRSLHAGEMRAFRASFQNAKGEIIKKRGDRALELLIAQCMCNSGGDRILTDDDALSPDFDLLDGAEIAALSTECKLWTGFGNDGDWSAIEDAAKNSESTHTS